MITTMHEYRILYRDSDDFEGLHTVFIFAKSKSEAEAKLINTLEIQKHWIESIYTWRVNVDVFVGTDRINEVYVNWANQRTLEEYIKEWTR
jgi:hypothetical protein|tara:strand:+ start:5110 stop:5382 length:273 start_codon:yes stop_codon:yes gene_type:complete